MRAGNIYLTSNEKLMYNTHTFLRNSQRLLAISLLVASLVSCKKELLDPNSTTLLSDNTLNGTASISSLSSLLGILWSDNLEGLSFLNIGVSKQTSTSYGITTTTSPVYQGIKSARFELRSGDPETNGGTRAELSFPLATSLNRWYSYALYAPSAQYKYDDDDEVLSQWHQGGGETPALCIRVREDRLYIRILGTWVDLGVFEKDKWQAYVMHIIHSSGSDGLIEFWRNGVKIMNRTGPNMYSLSDDDFHYPYLKMGIYKSDWNGSSTTSTSVRVLYYDDIKIGNELATYSTMAPTPNYTAPTAPSSGSEPAPTPTPTPTPTSPTTSTSTMSITSFRLINAVTETEVMSITNGQTISLSALGLSKVNIRVTTTTPSASVKMELSGTQSKTYTDSESPYALHGDDDEGNYFYGNWYPPALGTYTLKATPYTEDDAEGTAGISKTITFTFIK
jgi:hypothetical protein